MAKRTRAKQAERDAWWERSALPVVVLGIDPGATAGAGLSVPRDGRPALLWVREVDSMSRALERTVEDAMDVADTLGLDLVFAIETWGAGGPMGINAWVGLGAARGYWKRAIALAASEDPRGLITKSRATVDVNMRTWRSYMIPEHGTRTPDGKYVPHDDMGWKRAATSRVCDLAPDVRIDSADGAEAGLVALYTHRSDELYAKLPKGLQARVEWSAA